MTVCIAAICEQETVIVGAADRMLTAGDVQFEPPDIKIVPLTNSVVALMSGDSTFHSDILQRVRKYLAAQRNEDDLDVRDVAELYERYYGEVRQKRAERAILAPLGLTSESFIAKQKEMAPEFVKQLGTELINFAAGDVGAIICGVDGDGPHIWTLCNDELKCFDKAGFAAIGAGAWHAESQFMFAEHSCYTPFPEAVLLTYTAKKRAEVAPGVGEYTDMFFIGPAPGSFSFFGDHVEDKLEEIYEETREQQEQLLARANEEMNRYAKQLSRASVAKKQRSFPTDDGGSPPVDKKQIPDGTKAKSTRSK